MLGGFYPTFTTVQSLLVRPPPASSSPPAPSTTDANWPLTQLCCHRGGGVVVWLLQDLGVSVHMVSAGHLHSAVLTTDGALYAWGYNHSGCCGQPLVEQFIPVSEGRRQASQPRAHLSSHYGGCPGLPACGSCHVMCLHAGAQVHPLPVRRALQPGSEQARHPVLNHGLRQARARRGRPPAAHQAQRLHLHQGRPELLVDGQGPHHDGPLSLSRPPVQRLTVPRVRACGCVCGRWTWATTAR